MLTSVHPGGIKTGIARGSRLRDTMQDLGLSVEGGPASVEKNFITSPDKAARIIIGAVEKNKRRVLVGPDAYVYDSLVRLLPSAYQRIAVGFARRAMK